MDRLGSDADRWARFALRRSGRLLVSLWVLVTMAFLMIHLIPGDPVRAQLGSSAPPELVATRRAQLGLDDPLPAQYAGYLRGVLTGDLGTSFATRSPVAEVISRRLPHTVELAVLAVVVAAAVAVPVGAAMAVATRRGRRRFLDLGFTAGSVVVGTIPDFVVGVVLVWILAVSWSLFPIAGRAGPGSYVLPVLSLALGAAAVLARIVRIEMTTVLEADYIRTARAKRLRARTIHLRHALPNAVTSTLTIGGLLLSSLVAGTVLVENVFAWPGLGATIVQSIVVKDYPVVQGAVLVYGAGTLIINTVVDVALAALDPRSTILDG